MTCFKNNISKIIIITTVLSLIMLFSCNQKSTRKKIDLNSGWEFYFDKTDKWYPASVPGNIHTDLLANGLIEDPFYGTNSDSLKWISDMDWKYRTEFDIAPEFYSRNLELVFDGIDTHSEVFLNGEKLGETQNMFRQWVFVINDSIRKKTDNKLEVVFHPSSKYNSEKQNQGGYAIPDNRTFTRKAQYQYGWDWAPNLETCGIYKDVYITSWEKLRTTNVNIEQNLITDTMAVLTAYIELESENFYNGDVLITSPEIEFDSLHSKLDIYEGKQIYPVEFRIKKPQLWWCNGLGQQKLYDIKLEVSTKFRIEERNIKIGLRKIEVSTNTDEQGQELYFILNGRPVFAKGANWVPAEYFSGANSYEKYRELLILAKEANFNMLRVWGGGIYENDDFYNLCDSLGIMVWQDFMFACAMYPLDDEMTANITEEVKYQVNRLYNHPSLVMYCGNNEISNGWFDWGWQKQFSISEVDSVKIWNDYDNLFHRIIPKTIAEIDKSRTYIPSSPFYGWGHEESLTHGDSHYWGVWWGMEDFDMYFTKTGRFMSEYGFQAFPEMNSLRKFIPEDSLFRYSSSLKVHQKHSFGFKAINEYMEREYPVPEKFEDYIYMSQLMQAEGIQHAFDANLSAMPYCMGTLFWQFNDCWPVISWSAVDYYNQPKALYYYAKRSFENIFISSFVQNQEFKTYVVNQNYQSINVKIKIEVCNFSGKKLIQDSTIIIADMTTATQVIFDNINYDSIAKYMNDSYINLKVIDFNTGEMLCERTVTTAKNKDLRLPKSALHYSSTRQKDYYEIKIKSTVFIKSLGLTSTVSSGRFSDNYFDLIPGKEKTIRFYPESPSDKFVIRFNSLNKILNEVPKFEVVE